jgi:hypothetical protein
MSKKQVTNLEEFDIMVEEMRAGYIANQRLTCIIEDEEQYRTSQQNKALHVFCSLLAKALNEVGLDMQKTLATAASIPWSGDSIKESVWRPVQIAMFKKKSTTSLSSKQVSKVYEVINRHMGENHGVSMPFPHYDGIDCK